MGLPLGPYCEVVKEACLTCPAPCSHTHLSGEPHRAFSIMNCLKHLHKAPTAQPKLRRPLNKFCPYKGLRENNCLAHSKRQGGWPIEAWVKGVKCRLRVGSYCAAAGLRSSIVSEPLPTYPGLGEKPRETSEKLAWTLPSVKIPNFLFPFLLPSSNMIILIIKEFLLIFL